MAKKKRVPPASVSVGGGAKASLDSLTKMSGTGDVDVRRMFAIPERFAILNRLVTRDLNGRHDSPTFTLFTKDQISEFLRNPYKYEKQLRQAVTYIYGASPHFRRIIQYFVGLSDLSYVVSPTRIDSAKAKAKSVNSSYRKVLNTMSAMSVRTQFPKILTVCLREDVFYGTMWVTKDNITIQQLPSDYCAISSVEGNVPNVTFDFSYFDSRPQYLDLYPNEFRTKYEKYKIDHKIKHQELDSPTSFAIKCNNDILSYAIPPFAGVLREIYDVEDYRTLKNTRTALENYAMLVMCLGINDDGDWQIDFDKAQQFFNNLSSVLPEEVGAVLSPMKIDKISFEKSNTANTDTVAEAEESLFTASGVSSLLFNNERASGNALELSIKADQAITYGIVKSIEDAVNRYIQSQSYGKNFKVTFLDCSPFNRQKLGDMYLKACQYGMPMVSYYCASQGLGQEELDCMNFLENEVLGLKEKLVPLKSSATQSGESKGATDEGGAPTKDIGELSDSREVHRDEE